MSVVLQGDVGSKSWVPQQRRFFPSLATRCSDDGKPSGAPSPDLLCRNYINCSTYFCPLTMPATGMWNPEDWSLHYKMTQKMTEAKEVTMCGSSHGGLLCSLAVGSYSVSIDPLKQWICLTSALVSVGLLWGWLILDAVICVQTSFKHSFRMQSGPCKMAHRKQR